jgi:CheY-like chemotaxis protein
MKTSILIIDDSKRMRRQVADILRHAALFKFFFEAGDGIEGFKMALDKKPDIILCDIEMPGMDGFKFLRMLSTQEDLQDTPVIIVTGHEVLTKGNRFQSWGLPVQARAPSCIWLVLSILPTVASSKLMANR